MLDYLTTATTATTASSVTDMLIAIAISVATGLAISLAYMATNKRSFSQSLAVTLVFMPAVISTIIMLVGENIAAAFSLAGIFTIIRFRSAPGSAKDILLILFGVGAGLAYGVQLYLYGIVFTLAVLLVQFALHAIRFGKPKGEKLQLKIVAPDSANNEATFAKVLEKHVQSYHLERIGTRDLGSVYELIYSIEVPWRSGRKELIDELRRHNSNLNITVMNGETGQGF